MAAASFDLQSLRRRLDVIDNRMHDLLIERAEIIAAVAATKRRDNAGFYQPSREAEIIRRLAARHRGPLPFAGVARIWREVLTGSVGLETPFAVAVCGDAEAPALWDLARDHYGSQTPISTCRSSREVVDAVALRSVSVGVVPMPSPEDPDPWWPHLLSERQEMPRVVARLPFAARGNARAGNDALAIGYGTQSATSADRTLLAIETASCFDGARIRSMLSSAGLACALFARCERGRSLLDLAELEGCVAPEDARLGAVRGALGAALYRLTALGGYALPLPAALRAGAAAAPFCPAEMDPAR